MNSEGVCRRCPKAVVMLKHTGTGNYAPIEVAPSEKGNIMVDRQNGTYTILTKGALQKARDKGHPLHLNHFASCEYARSFARTSASKTALAPVGTQIPHERRQQIIDSLASDVCGACGRVKRRRMSHCRACYYRLPAPMRTALYREWGHGYEEAYEASIEFLKGRSVAA